MRHSVEGCFKSRVSKAIFTALTPLTLSMLGNILTMSKLTNVTFSGKPFAFKLSMISSRWYESLILVQCFQLMAHNVFPQK